MWLPGWGYRWPTVTGGCVPILTLPEGGVTSLCFGGADFDTLYIVCDGRLYKRKMKLPGVPPLGGTFRAVPRRRGLSSCCDLGTSHGSGIAATGVQQFSDIVQLPVVFALEFQSPVSERGQFYGKPDPGCDRAYQLVTVGSGKAFLNHELDAMTVPDVFRPGRSMFVQVRHEFHRAVKQRVQFPQPFGFRLGIVGRRAEAVREIEIVFFQGI